jgi:hypothetical protein
LDRTSARDGRGRLRSSRIGPRENCPCGDIRLLRRAPSVIRHSPNATSLSFAGGGRVASARLDGRLGGCFHVREERRGGECERGDGDSQREAPVVRHMSRVPCVPRVRGNTRVVTGQLTRAAHVAGCHSVWRIGKRASARWFSREPTIRDGLSQRILLSTWLAPFAFRTCGDIGVIFLSRRRWSGLSAQAWLRAFPSGRHRAKACPSGCGGCAGSAWRRRTCDGASAAGLRRRLQGPGPHPCWR